MERGPVEGRSLLAALGLWLAAAAVAIGLLLLAGRLLGRSYYRAHQGDFAAGLLLGLYLLLFAALWRAFGGPAGLRDRLGFRFTSVADLAAAPFVWLLTAVVGALATIPFTHWLGPPQSNATGLVRDASDPVSTVVLIATVTVVAPVCEELLFRGAVFGWLRRRAPVALAAPLSAAVFAGAHIFPPGFVVLFAFGLGTALFYQRTGSTLNSAVMHACQNALAVIVVFTGAGATPR